MEKMHEKMHVHDQKNTSARVREGHRLYCCQISYSTYHQEHNVLSEILYLLLQWYHVQQPSMRVHTAPGNLGSLLAQAPWLNPWRLCTGQGSSTGKCTSRIWHVAHVMPRNVPCAALACHRSLLTMLYPTCW